MSNSNIFTPSQAKMIADTYAENVARANNAQLDQACIAFLAELQTFCVNNPDKRRYRVNNKLLVGRLREKGWTIHVEEWTGPDCDCTSARACECPSVVQQTYYVTW